METHNTQGKKVIPTRKGIFEGDSLLFPTLLSNTDSINKTVEKKENKSTLHVRKSAEKELTSSK